MNSEMFELFALMSLLLVVVAVQCLVIRNLFHAHHDAVDQAVLLNVVEANNRLYTENVFLKKRLGIKKDNSCHF